MTNIKIIFALFIISLFSSVLQTAAQSRSVSNTDAALNVLLKNYVSKRNISDWEVIVLGINDTQIKTPLFSTDYFKRTEKEIKNVNGTYRVVTDYARVALAWKSHGKDARNIAGYDFINAIINFKNMQNQGLNAYVWALIALYGQDETVTASMVENILKYQRPSGGFAASLPSVSKPEPVTDIDYTAMAVTALAPYEAVDTAISFLSESQLSSGGFMTNGVENCESLCQVIIALCSAGTDINDKRFIKQGKTLLDALDEYRLRDGTYAHTPEDTKFDIIATRQAALALSAVKRAARYNSMTDAERNSSGIRRGIFEL